MWHHDARPQAFPDDTWEEVQEVRVNVLAHSVDDTSVVAQRALKLKEALIGEINCDEVKGGLILVAELNFQSITGPEDPLKLKVSPQLVIESLPDEDYPVSPLLEALLLEDGD